jgi:UDP-N-acetylmuramyl pentapeptide synthase
LFDWISKVSEPLGIAINLDDELVVKAWKDAFTHRKVRTVTFSSWDPTANIFISKKEIDPKLGHLAVELKSEEGELRVNIPHFGMHHAAATCR